MQSPTSANPDRTETGRTVLILWDADYPWDVRVQKVGETLAANGWSVHILARNLQRRATLEYLGPLQIHRLKALPSWLGALNDFISFPAFINPVWWIAALKTARKTRADLIVVRDLPLAPVGILTGNIRRRPVVMDMAESYPEMVRNVWTFAPWKFRNVFLRNPWLAGLVEKFVLPRLDGVLVVVSESRDRLASLGASPHRITIVSNTPDTSRFGSSTQSVQVDHTEVRLAYVGLLGYSRGLDVAIRGLHLFREKGGKARLEIFGTGRAEHELRALVDKMDLADTVRFRGWLDNSSVPEVLADTDVGIVPHRRCGHWDTTIPNKLFDYMAAQRPVLVSDTPPMRRIVTETHCGLIFKDNDPQDFARQLERLASPALRIELGRRGRQAVEEEWNWSRDAARLVEALETVTNNTKY